MLVAVAELAPLRQLVPRTVVQSNQSNNGAGSVAEPAPHGAESGPVSLGSVPGDDALNSKGNEYGLNPPRERAPVSGEPWLWTFHRLT